MLESIEIQNFRSCDNVRLRLTDSVVALLGKNGAGKTNVLHAIQLAANLCVGEPDSIFGFNSHDRSKPTAIRLEFNIDGSRHLYRISRGGPKSKDSNIEEELQKDGKVLFHRNGEVLSITAPPFPGELRVLDQTRSLYLLTQVLPPDAELHQALKRVATYLRAVHYYPLPQNFQEHAEKSLSPFVDSSAYERWKSRLAGGDSGESVTYRLLHLKLTNPAKIEELQKLLGEDGLGLISDIRVEEVKVPRAGKSAEVGEPAYLITFVPCEGIAGAGRSFRHSGLSAGTWRVIRLLTYLIFDESSCMLVEQPEDSIHAGLLGKLIDILKTYSERTQLICTTHSPRVMNLVGAAGIRLVTADAGHTQVMELTPDQIQASSSYLQDEGTLAEFLQMI